MVKKSILLSLVVTSIILNAGCHKDEIDGLPFRLYEDYFVMDSLHIDSTGSFCEFNEMVSFDTVFGVSALNSKGVFLSPADFDENFVIAVIKDNGYNSYDLKITRIDTDTFDQQVINVNYEYNLIESNISWSQRGYSIAMLSKLNHHMIRFFENGLLVKELGD